MAHGRPADRPRDGFKLKPRDAKAKKQLKVIKKLLKRDDVDQIVNACDAGREGELIFAYIYESVFGGRRRDEAGRAALDLLDDQARRSARASSACARASRWRRSRRRRARAPRPTGSSA